MEDAVSVRETMTREFVGVSESDPVRGAVELLLSENGWAAVVLQGSDPVGLLTKEAALANLLDDPDGEGPVGDVMDPSVPTVSPDRSLGDAAGMMVDENADAVLVVDDETPIGIVTNRDVVDAIGGYAVEPRAGAPSSRPDAGETGAIENAEPPGPEGAETGTREFSNQGVCEVCGKLTPDLANVNGQLVCADCRSV